MIVDAIKKEFQKAIRRKWDKIYVFVDLHEIIIHPTWGENGQFHKYYPHAKELLQELSARKDICLVMWTCSHPEDIQEHSEIFKLDDIVFDYIDENPEVQTNQAYGNYDRKPYYNIMLDDKAGVIPEELSLIREEFKKYKL